jgi:hypothetical protein
MKTPNDGAYIARKSMRLKLRRDRTKASPHVQAYIDSLIGWLGLATLRNARKGGLGRQ